MLLSILVTAVVWTQGKSLVIPSNLDTSVGIPEYYYDTTDLKTLKLTQVIFRHGSRSPFHPYPTDPNANYDYGVPGSAQLLEEGRKQAYNLGTYLQRRYDGYLSQTYLADEVYARSSDADRTIMTAEMCLAGMYPYPSGEIEDMSNWQPIPVHSLPKWTDNKIEFDEECEQYDLLLENYLNSQPMKDLDADLADVYQILTKYTGLNVTNRETLKFIADAITIEQEHGLELPAWINEVPIDKVLYSLLLQFTEKTATPTLQRLFISPLFTDMVRNMQWRITGSPFFKSDSSDDLSDYHNRTAKLYIFSGHDTTITGFLNSFNIYDGVPPGFVANIIIELHQSEDQTQNDLNENEDNYIVKAFYKKKPNELITELSFPKCPNPCKFSSFKANYAYFLMDNTQWKKECTLCIS